MEPILTKPRTNEQYTNDLVNLLPEGSAWDAKYSSNSTMYKMLYAWISPLSAVDTSLCFMIDDANPALTQSPEVLEYYQNLLGLPNKCISADSTFEEQRQQVVSRFGIKGGMNKDYYVSMAESFGLNLNIIEYSGALCDLAEVDSDSSCVADVQDTFDEFKVTFEVDGDYTLFQCSISDLIPAYLVIYWAQKD
ncbi:putative phage tail protein [Gluconobacter albidus]|uniref:Uncharacterized protein n=2 Tax=Gluconobacter albidus TaxID=318683 RepID=A0ABQ5X3R8_9PROT|nr:putative phage tail protein [Gluconobacter albidus]GBQ89578.1 hypothetical protein AA3250_1847 [Gluconobacter albidus NBRC 3250]GLQ69502.1 hypothetical protein GCM10007866_19540 [Gluconobacter albidus]